MTAFDDISRSVLFDRFDRILDDAQPALEIEEIAQVVDVTNGVARIRGFGRLCADELVVFANGGLGLASSIGEKQTGVIVLGSTDGIFPGDRVRRTGRVAEVPVGDGLLGRVVDALGRPQDRQGALYPEDHLPVERPAPPIMHRAPVEIPLQTGIKAIDAAIPVGRGQRELILGDRQTGKTAIALNAILNQRDTGVVSIYCAIGQRASAVARVIKTLREHGALERTIVVVASGQEAPGLQFIAPYAATTMAEHFMHQGRDALIVYDDLTSHARAYRELSLLLRRPPGREAYPGDIFHIHARLLERATRLRGEQGGGSLTAFPIIETQAQNISDYIPTNLISITDGQIYVSPKLFDNGQLPAIDIGQSVSRVGGKTQLPAYRAVAGDLRLFYAQFEELETFARFGAQIDSATRSKLVRGRRVREALKQKEFDHLDAPDQIAFLLAATTGVLDDVPVNQMAEAEITALKAVRAACGAIRQSLANGNPLLETDRADLIATMTAALEDLRTENGVR
ncbi:F0F1 ATP synthase subunit alpha [Arenibacterium sp. CAU 1754]